MAAPTFVAASAGATDASGAFTFTCAAPGAAGRLLIVHIVSDGTSNGLPDMGGDTGTTNGSNINGLDGTANQWTRLKSSAPAVFGMGNPQSAFHNLWAGRSTGTSAPTFFGTNNTGDDLYFRAYEFQNANTGTTLAAVFENGSIDMSTTGSGLQVQNTGTSVTKSDIVTNGSDRLAVVFIGVNDDVTVAEITGESGGSLTEAVAEYSVATGTDAALSLQIAAMAAAGTLSGGSATLGASAGWGSVAFAIIGTTVDVPKQAGQVAHRVTNQAVHRLAGNFREEESGLLVPDRKLWTPSQIWV